MNYMLPTLGKSLPLVRSLALVRSLPMVNSLAFIGGVLAGSRRPA